MQRTYKGHHRKPWIVYEKNTYIQRHEEFHHRRQHYFVEVINYWVIQIVRNWKEYKCGDSSMCQFSVNWKLKLTIQARTMAKQISNAKDPKHKIKYTKCWTVNSSATNKMKILFDVGQNNSRWWNEKTHLVEVSREWNRSDRNVRHRLNLGF